MSHIKRLKIKGFKSFANPTVLNFEKGFNTIVGANGSGKSNVFDAMCFVLGRISSKGLRADKLGNLVFNGGKTQKPAKEAEVDIYLSNENKELLNTDLNEIKISRIVKKNGQSNYYLNNNKVTRTEILEILKKASINPDGYNIILQGDITKVVNMNPIERRQLIEEISNISGYEDKRQKAMTKLEKIENNLKDADLLMAEKTKYLKELKSEKEQAEKYHQTKEDLNFNNLLLTKAKIIKNTLIKNKKQEELQENEKNLTENKEKLNQLDNQIKKIEEEITKLEKSIEVKSHQDFISVTNKITATETEIKNLKEKKAEHIKNLEELKTKTKELKKNIEENETKKANTQKQIKELETKKTEFNKNLKEIEKQTEDLRKKLSPGDFSEFDKIDKEIEKLNQKKHEKNQIRQDNAIQIEKLKTKIEHLENDMTKIEELNSSNKQQFSELEKHKKELKKLILEISTKTNKNSEISAKLNNLQKEYSDLTEENSRLQMRARASQEVLTTNNAVKKIIELKNKDKNIHGMVSELASVPEKYSMAIETAIGNRLFNIIVENENTAIKYINYLKENRIGNATFLPLNKINAKINLDHSALKNRGVIDYAIKLIKFNSRYENIFNLLLRDTLIIEKIEDAKNIGIGKYQMISLDGDISAKSGAMSGGFKSRKKSMGLFKDETLLKKLEKTEEHLSSLQSTISLLKEQKEDSEREIYELRHKKIDIESELAKLEKILSIEGKDTQSIRKEIENIIPDKTVIESSLKKIDRDINSLNEEISKQNIRKNELKTKTSTKSSAMTDLEKTETKRDKLKEEIASLTNETDFKKIQLKNIIDPEIANIEKIIKETNTSINHINSSSDQITQQIKSLSEELKINKEKEKELSKDYKEFISKRDTLKEEKQKIETKYNKEHEKFEKIKEKSTIINISISEYETLNNTLTQELEQTYLDLKIELSQPETQDEETDKKLKQLIESVEKKLKETTIDIKELQHKVNTLKTKLSSFGSINMKAVAVYDKLNEEFNELLEKRETLNSEKTEILKFVSEMDGKKKEKFLETFEKLHHNFTRIFSSLTTKGDAELLIENEKDLFNTGIDLRVKLSQKTYLDLKSLSGGEKTITAIAFLFAIQEFEPASFYLLDEVDAALDMVNAEKLGALIKNYAKHAQYVVVSHSEYLIQSAGSIYGVTMDKNKISGVVTLDLKNATEYIETTEA